MRVFTIHLRRRGLDPDRDIVLVKEGFCWPAFFLGPLWALWHRMWWTAAGLLALTLGVGLAAERLLADPDLSAVVSLALAAGIGFVANDLRRRDLAARGFDEAGLATGRDADSALHRYLEGDPDLARELAPYGAGTALS